MSKVRHLWLQRVDFAAIARRVEALEFSRLRTQVEDALRRVAAARERAREKRKAHLHRIK